MSRFYALTVLNASFLIEPEFEVWENKKARRAVTQPSNTVTMMTHPNSALRERNTKGQFSAGETIPLHPDPFFASIGCSISFLQRFYAKVKITESCWLWTGAKSCHGYGSIYAGALNGIRVVLRANIASWIIHFHEVPDREVCHDCPTGDNKLCVNPAHLWLGTRDENASDAGLKGQMPYGVHNWNATLNEEKVRQIRLLRLLKWSSDQIARTIRTAPDNVRYVIERNGWRRTI